MDHILTEYKMTKFLGEKKKKERERGKKKSKIFKI